MAFVFTNGLFSGVILAAFLALCDGLFETNTFDVLIDVSYIPHLAGLPSIVELLIHFLLSIIVTFLFAYLYPLRNWMVPRYLGIWIGLFFILYFPLSLFSGQGLSFWACIIWMLGHLLYVLFLAYQVEHHG